MNWLGRRERRRRHGWDCSTRSVIRRSRQRQNEGGCGKYKRRPDQCHRNDGRDERSGCAHRTAEHLARQARVPGAAVHAQPTIGERHSEDSRVEIRRRLRFRNGPEELDESRRSAELGGAARAVADVLGQPTGVGLVELVEQVGVDQAAGAMIGLRATQGAHTQYKTRGRR